VSTSAPSQQQAPAPLSQVVSCGSPNEDADRPSPSSKNVSESVKNESVLNTINDTKLPEMDDRKGSSLENPFKISNFAKRESDRILELEEEVQELRRKLERAEARLVSV
jgi:hypothetical protein